METAKHLHPRTIVACIWRSMQWRRGLHRSAINYGHRRQRRQPPDNDRRCILDAIRSLSFLHLCVKHRFDLTFLFPQHLDTDSFLLRDVAHRETKQSPFTYLKRIRPVSFLFATRCYNYVKKSLSSSLLSMIKEKKLCPYIINNFLSCPSKNHEYAWMRTE